MTVTRALTESETPVALPELAALYRQMIRIREFELRTADLYRDGVIPGFVHLSVGQEAVAVGVCSQLRADDVITSTHRGHGHVMAKGLDMTAMFAELMGRATGVCGGFGGSMHIADPTLGIFGANGIVGAGVPIAGGAALAASLQDNGRVTAAFFGDGAVATGAFHESVNLAALWKLPLLLVCENNGFSEFSRTSDQHPVSMAERSRGYGIVHELVDGNDVEAVARAANRLVRQVRETRACVLLEAVTERVYGHYEGDQQRYRGAHEPRAEDPLERTRKALVARGYDEGAIARVDREVRVEVDRAAATAQDAPWPDAARIHELGDVRCIVARHYREIDARSMRAEPVPPSSSELRGSQSVRLALDDALAQDPLVFLAGIDVGAGGGVFGITKGLAAKYPGRLFDTPIAETAIMGLGVGAAMAGLRPVVELMYLDFIGVCLDQLLNQAAKLSFMTGGGTDVAMVVRTQFGVGRSSGSQHSQSLEALLAHIPGLVVLMPATVTDMYGLLRSAIDFPGPVVVIENRLLYEVKGPAPPADHRTPIGKAAIVRAGTDVTVVTASRTLYLGLQAADVAAAQGISCEVIDLRTIAPLDTDTVLESLSRTNRLVIVTEASGDFGIGSEIAARAVDEGFWSLDAPVRRVTGLPTPVPYSPPLEQAWLPNVERVLSQIRSVCADR